MIVYNITSHGYGHAVRSCEVIRNLDPALPLTIRTTLPEWFLRHELGAREFTLARAAFDCGVLGPDSVHVDLAATVELMEKLLPANEARLDDEVAYLKRCGARVVVSDVPPFPLRTARAAAVPSVLIANFTWSAIYEYLVENFCDDAALAARARRVIDAMQAEYDEGDLLLAPDMAVEMHACRRRRDVPLIARRGRDRRAEIIQKLGLDPRRPLGLLYLGRDGMDGIDWSKLAGEEIQLIAYVPPPGADSLIHPIPEDMIDHVDAAASVDIVIAKSGYGICGECITAGVPLVFPPRPEFAEMIAIYDLMKRWGGGVPIGDADFRALNWRPYIDEALRPGRHLYPIDCSGGAVCARAIENLWHAA